MKSPNMSIHPHRWDYGSDYRRSNTAKPRSRSKLERQLKSIEGHLETHPQDHMSRTRVDAIKSAMAELR
jgi:ribosomal protein S15P/S13E